MDKYVEVMRHVIELSETVDGGLEHIKRRINEGYFEDTIQLFTDVVEAFSHIEKSIQPLLPHLPQNNLDSLTISLHESFEYAVSAYEKGEGGKVLEIIQFNLLPMYKKWQTVLEATLRPYITN
jgi:RNA binding exosome subunit